MATKIMIDIETLATTTDALVLSIGAVKFDLFEEMPVFNDTHLVIPSMLDQIMYGRHVDRKTQDWWSKQPPQAADHWRDAMKVEPVAPWSALLRLQQWMDNPAEVWANGIVFDCGILDHLAQQSSLKTELWKYNAPRDVRTIKAVCSVVRKPTEGQAGDILNFIPHHPLGDCKRQIWDLWSVWPGELPSISSQQSPLEAV